MITYAEIKFMEYLRKITGSFHTKLFDLIFVADTENFRKIGEAFPDECETVKKYREERGYFPELEKRYANRFAEEKSNNH